MATMQFQRATRKKSKLRLALAGTSGSGKTTGALKIARGLGGKIAVIDTERGSASLYSHLFEYDTLELQPPYAPERFIEAIHAAEGAGYDVVVIDSITHEWNGAGGVLEIVDMLAKASRSGSSYNAWNEGSSRHRKFVDAMLQSACHVIVTMRSKAAYVQEKNEKTGKTEIRKAGMAPEQRDGIEYEFTTMLDISNDGHIATSSKDRTGLFADPFVISEATGAMLRTWLDSGAEMLPNDAAKPASPATDNVEKRDKAIRYFRSLIQNTEHSDTEIAEKVSVAHAKLNEDQELYAAVWRELSTRDREDIENFIEKHKAAKAAVLPNGRAAA